MIYLDETQNEHKLLIDAIEASNIAPWIKKSLIGRVQSDIDEKLARSACEHNFGSYIGKKECCKKCGGYGTNMGTTWTLTTDIDEGNGEQKSHQA